MTPFDIEEQTLIRMSQMQHEAMYGSWIRRMIADGIDEKEAKEIAYGDSYNAQ